MSFLYRILQSKEEAKTRKRYNQVPHLTQDTIWKHDKHITYKRAQEVSPFSVGDHKAARNRQDSMAKTKTKHKQQKDPHIEHCLGTVSYKITGGLKYFSRYQLKP